MSKHRDFAKVIRDKLSADADLARSVEEEALSANIAVEIFNARTEAGLTQGELADLIDSQQSAISRLEDTNYGRHSFTMLNKIAEALGKRLRVRFIEPRSYTHVNEQFSTGQSDEYSWDTKDAWKNTKMRKPEVVSK